MFVGAILRAHLRNTKQIIEPKKPVIKIQSTVTPDEIPHFNQWAKHIHKLSNAK